MRRSKKTPKIPKVRPFDGAEYLKENAIKNGMTVGELRAQLVEEGLRQDAFGYIDFRDSASGRQSYLKGSSLAVWEVMLLAAYYDQDVVAVAKHLRWHEVKAQAAFYYAEVFPQEIKRALTHHHKTDFKKLSKSFPYIQGVDLSGSTNTDTMPAPNLRLLLDEQISPKVAKELKRRGPGLMVHTLVGWDNGLFLGINDEVILECAAGSNLIFVTYDRGAMAALLHNWSETGDPHRGVILIDDRTIPPTDSEGLVDKLQKFIRISEQWTWDNRVCYLHR